MLKFGNSWFFQFQLNQVLRLENRNIWLLFFFLIHVYKACNWFIFPTFVTILYLGDNCIVFDNFMASIGDLMVAN